MTYIITRLCRDCLDTGCVAVCPVDCIYKYVGDDNEQFPFSRKLPCPMSSKRIRL